jgi:RNA polymerase sigma-70 factor (ECF subfamily)
MSEDPSAELLARWRAGDSQAGDELFGRYTERLIALAGSRLSEQMARRIDPEDVVQSAYRCFCAGARDDRFVLEGSGDLWCLLAAITLHRLRDKVDYHKAGRRSVEREQVFGGESSLCALDAAVVSHEPDPASAAALIEELELLLSDMSPTHRRMVELRLQGYLIEEIAVLCERSEGLVRRVLRHVKDRLKQRCVALSES